jgi:manganese/zinc/iron transport system permease protein
LTALLGLWVMHGMERKLKVPSDAALCFVLASFFSIGITIASEMQFSYTTFYKRVQAYLYGQAATMTDIHILIYGLLACLVLGIILSFYKELQAITFDRQFAKTIGIPTRSIDALLFVLVVLAVVIGIRSVGVILMSAMLIAPPAAARQFTHRLSVLLGLSAFFGVLSGFFGNYLSVIITNYLLQAYPDARITLPTGPMIVLVASIFCVGALLCAPERGLLIRFMRVARFRYRCACENLLKAMWRLNPTGSLNLDQLAKFQMASKFYLKFVIWRLVRNGWLKKTYSGEYQLTLDGRVRAAKIIRLHRLWELYLADYLGVGTERVHRNAEEMEHIITSELESELSLLLNDPKQDPHHQPIPAKEDFNVF